MEIIFGIAIGVGLGWVVFKRPQWVEQSIATAKRKLNRG